MSRGESSSESGIFDAETWAELPAIIGQLPEVVRLIVWGDAASSYGEREAVTLCHVLAGHFKEIHFQTRPRRDNYPYYPVIGVLGEDEGEEIDFGLRIIGLPSGYQMTSLITAIQAVSFRGATLSPVTRIKLHRLVEDKNIELLTSAENEGGPVMAKILFGLAVASPRVKSFMIMTDFFPEANLRYSVDVLPHTVINGHVHIEGVVDEHVVVKHIIGHERLLTSPVSSSQSSIPDDPGGSQPAQKE